jgi:hypothetical protein
MALAMTARRHYSSDDKTGKGTEEPVKENAEGQEEDPRTDAEPQLLTKLQAKEQEVVDLTVRGYCSF